MRRYSIFHPPYVNQMGNENNFGIFCQIFEILKPKTNIQFN